MKRKKSLVIVGIIAAAILASGGIYIYFTQLAPQTVIQTNPDTVNCRQGNVLDGVERQARFTVLSTCEMAIG